MKKILISLYTILALSATSCSDFLDSHPSYAVDTDVAVTDEVAEALTNACYTPLQSSNLYNMRIWSLDIIAGNSDVGGGGGEDGIETVQCANFAAASDNAYALYVWRSPWVGIGQCNIVINSLSPEGLSAEIYNRSMGEAYFLRAHYYYILVRLFGGVPLRLEIGPKDLEKDQCVLVRRDTREKVFVSLDELETAIPAQLEALRKDLYQRALENREKRTWAATTMDEVKELAKANTGYIKTMWCGDLACEMKMKEEAGLSSRCMPFEQEQLSDVCPCCGKPAKAMVYWGVAY